MSGCPKCASKRLRSAPLPLVSPVAALLARRWRYACPVCQWSGWKRRMRRTDRISVARTDPDTSGS
jgi:hypothetical protein